MQIRSLRFANLNSLAGSWEIDLSHPAYVSDGIFAITGPTGAGKSTLLDAICLALYGRTPRLDRVSQGSNEIMSRHTGACFAEVTFATAAGVFRCHWSQRRARKKADGALQPPKHEIADAQTGQLLETKIRDVAARVVAVTGMDFERFTRSMLLAQGGFAAFLQADADARAPILEQITGTDIYSRISIIVHERQRAEQDQLRLLQAALQGVQLLAPEQEQELAQAQAARQHEADQAATRLAQLTAAVNWRRRLLELEQEITALATQEQALQHKVAAFQPEQQRLQWALRAAELDGPWAALAAQRKQQADDAQALQAEQQALPALQATVQESSARLQAARAQDEQLNDQLQAAAPTWNQVRLLDQRLADQAEASASQQRACKQIQGELQEQQQRKQEQAQQLEQAREHQARIAGQLTAHASDAWLVGNLAAMETRLGHLQALQAEHEQQAQACRTAQGRADQASAALQNARKVHAQRQGAQHTAAQGLEQAQERLAQLLDGKLLREWRAQKEALLREMALLNRIASLEEERQHLHDGQPCPLCGATIHPYAAGQIPEPSTVEQAIAQLDEHITGAEQQEAAMMQQKAELQAATQARMNAEKDEASATHAEQAATSALQEERARLQQLGDRVAADRDTITQHLAPLGITAFDDATALLQALRQRLQDWRALGAAQGQSERQIAELQAKISSLDAALQARGQALEQAQAQLQQQQDAQQKTRSERSALYGDKSPQEEEDRLRQALRAAEAALTQAGEQHASAVQHHAAAQTRCASLQSRVQQRQPVLEQAEAEWTTTRQAAGFADEPAFLQARLPADERQALADRAQQLQQQQTELKARQHDRRQQLANEQAKALSEQALDELEQAQQMQEQATQQLRDTVAEIRQQLAANTQAKARIAAQQDQIRAQQQDCARWDDLHALIGSADGKKYRNFAQGLTFEIMVGHANRELQKMSDRYLLVRDAEQPLVLNVVDAWQAGEVRSTQNLSGGESFIVSLALALGLAQMASRNVRIDSLFLDEGFGTLDEQALDTALQALATLQQDGKLIGIISHVAALKERIAMQIRVEPRGNGRSVLSGPGCRQPSRSEVTG